MNWDNSISLIGGIIEAYLFRGRSTPGVDRRLPKEEEKRGAWGGNFSKAIYHCPGFHSLIGNWVMDQQTVFVRLRVRQ